MIFKRLRQETNNRHKALEARLPLLDPELSLGMYRQLVGRFYGYYAPLEDQLLHLPWWEEIGYELSPRLKTPSLRKDLVALGESSQAFERAPVCQELPGLCSIPQALGCLYVLEGATLGGQVITRHLQANLGLTPDSGGAFFAGYGAETGSRWVAFGLIMESAVERLGGEDEIVASANNTFATLERWLFLEPLIDTPI